MEFPEKVVTVCRSMAAEIELGLVMLPSQFQRFDFFDLTVNCGICGEMHSFSRREVWLKPHEEVPELPPWVRGGRLL